MDILHCQRIEEEQHDSSRRFALTSVLFNHNSTPLEQLRR